MLIWKPLYTGAKFAAARENRRITHPSLREARDPTGANGNVTGLFTITGELAGSRDPVFADQEQRASAISMTTGAIRPSALPHEEGVRYQGPNRRREGFQDRHARLTMPSSRVPPPAYVPRPGMVLRLFLVDIEDTQHPGIA